MNPRKSVSINKCKKALHKNVKFMTWHRGLLKQLLKGSFKNGKIFTLRLKVRQIRNDFFKPTFLPKNERTNSTLLLVDLFSFVFWKKVKTPKRHFEII